MDERVTAQIVEALQHAAANPGEHRLYRAGKLAGLFPARTGVAAEAAAQAVRDGLLEQVRTETKGKAVTEWVRLAPAGVEFLSAHESPLAVLRELQRELAAADAGAPAWLDAIQRQMLDFHGQLAEQLAQTQRRLAALADRVEEALRRADALGPALPEGVAGTVPWAADALRYLDQRRTAGSRGACPLPELFLALRRGTPALTLTDYQHGLRRLADHKALELLPFDGPSSQLPEPEYALLDGAQVLYYAAR